MSDQLRVDGGGCEPRDVHGACLIFEEHRCYACGKKNIVETYILGPGGSKIARNFGTLIGYNKPRGGVVFVDGGKLFFCSNCAKQSHPHSRLVRVSDTSC